jgi:hypothetical protein
LHKKYIFVNYNYIDNAKKNEMDRTCNTHGKRRNAYNVLGRNPEGKSLVGRQIWRLQINVKINIG